MGLSSLTDLLDLHFSSLSGQFMGEEPSERRCEGLVWFEFKEFKYINSR